ncbi:MAG: PEP-CTERM sorting domain-containing protein [Phycisphaerae bacterium]|jgi:hypothetical protein|nr:PEP-CTERM sorting domain-containing protein [Phycisphaerae bacterium]
MKRLHDRIGGMVAELAAVVLIASTVGLGDVVERVSVHPTGLQADAWSDEASLASGANRVAFTTEAALVSEDTNDGTVLFYPDGSYEIIGPKDIYVRDRTAQTTILVSVNGSGTGAANGASWQPRITPDGCLAAFSSYADDLVSTDNNMVSDVFVRNICNTTVSGLPAHTTELVSLPTGGAVYVPANGHSHSPTIDYEGRFVAFVSEASNLLSPSPDELNAQPDIYIRDRHTNVTRRLSGSPGGAEANGPSDAPAISLSGRYVAYQTDATNIVGPDNNGVSDVVMYDQLTGQTTRISVADGQEPNGASFDPAIAGDLFGIGEPILAYASNAGNLVDSDENGLTDIFTFDSETQETIRVSIAVDGGDADGNSYAPALTYDGRFVTFISDATNLVFGDTNDHPDTFLHDRRTGRTQLLSRAFDGALGDGAGSAPDVAYDGAYVTVAFTSAATNLIPADTNGVTDVFLSVSVPGDTDGDRDVDTTDLSNLIAQFGGSPGAQSADFNGNGTVDLEDFVILRGNFGLGVVSAPAAEFGATTPEPATLTLLTIGGLLLLRKRRKQ